jgi:hypothetical protein
VETDLWKNVAATSQQGADMSSIGSLLDRLFPLPPPERRRASAFLLKYMGPNLRLERDADYLTYVCYKFILIIYLLFLGLIVCDSYAGTNVLIAPGTFAHDKLLIPVAFTRFTAGPTLIVTLAFYLRIRFAIDLRHEMPPRVINKWALQNRPRWKWIATAVVGGAALLWAFFNWYRIVLGVNHRIEWGESLPVILMEQFLWIFIIASMPNIFIGLILFLEKTFRFFPEALQDLERPDY